MTAREYTPEEISATVEGVFDAPTSVFSSIDRFFHLRTELNDRNSGETIGHFVLSVIYNEKAGRHDVVDSDITFLSDTPVRLYFEKQIGEDNYGTPCYEAVTLDDDIDEQYLHVETVNRFTGYPNLNTHEADLNIALFPKEVKMFDSIEQLNDQLDPAFNGIQERPEDGYTDRFIAESQEGSFLVGTVKDMKNVSVSVGKLDLDFLLVQMETALGTVPAAMSPEVFGLDGIAPGKVLAMKAFVSGDLSDENMFSYKD